MKLPKQLTNGLGDLLAKLIFAGIAAVLTALIIPRYIVPLAYVWLVSILLLATLIVRSYLAFKDRPFYRRVKNEEEATPTIQKMVAQTRSKLCVLSKVGTSVFFLFRQYSRLLEDERVIQVLIVDPDDPSLISLMDKIYVQQRNVSNQWERLISQIRTELAALHGDGVILENAHRILNGMLSNESSYKNVIMASLFMWNLAQTMANERLQAQGKPVTVHGLDIRVYSVLPDIKAWIIDDACCALGHYSALHLGRDNPIDIYHPSKRHAMEHWQLENVLAVWKYKLATSRKLDIHHLLSECETNT